AEARLAEGSRRRAREQLAHAAAVSGAVLLSGEVRRLALGRVLVGRRHAQSWNLRVQTRLSDADGREVCVGGLAASDGAGVVGQTQTQGRGKAETRRGRSDAD